MRRIRSALTAAVLALPGMLPRAGASADTLKIASPQRGSWEGAIPELGKQQGIFQKHGLDLDILYTSGGGETLQAVVSGAVDIGLSAGTSGVFWPVCTARLANSGQICLSPDYVFVPRAKESHFLAEAEAAAPKALPTVGLAPHPEVVSDSPHLVETHRSPIGHSVRCSSE